MEDEGKLGSDQEVEDAEHELVHEKEPSKADLIKAYKESIKEKKEEEKKEWEKAKNKVIEIEDKYVRKR